MHGRSADRLAAVIAAHLQRIVAVDDAVVGPIELGLLGFVGSEVLQRPEIRTGIERDDGESVFGKLARQRPAAGAGADDDEINLVVVSILSHRHPRAGTEYVGRPAVGRARACARDQTRRFFRRAASTSPFLTSAASQGSRSLKSMRT